MECMSLLIPTRQDVADAHCLPELDAEYRGVRAGKWAFEVVQGYFAQSDPATDDSCFNFAVSHLGRLKEWDTIRLELEALNNASDKDTCYKVVFLARHGQGFHNLIVEKYGIDAWNAKWRNLYTDGTWTYGPDAMLSELGIAQAKENHAVWQQEVGLGAPLPSKFYVSPLQRLQWTMYHTWNGIWPENTKPIVVENLRELMDGNTCNMRLSKTEIGKRFPMVFEPGFTEEDERRDVREDKLSHALRANSVLESLFDEHWIGEVDKAQANQHLFVSTTSHAGTIRLALVALGHRRFTVSTGGMIPVVIKATRVE